MREKICFKLSNSECENFTWNFGNCPNVQLHSTSTKPLNWKSQMARGNFTVIAYLILSGIQNAYNFFWHI